MLERVLKARGEKRLKWDFNPVPGIREGSDLVIIDSDFVALFHFWFSSGVLRSQKLTERHSPRRCPFLTKLIIILPITDLNQT
jgi:hypothetical protein